MSAPRWYGIGPECRRGLPAGTLQRIGDLTARANADQRAPVQASPAAPEPGPDEDDDVEFTWTASDFGCMECGGALGAPDADEDTCECTACGEPHIIDDSYRWDGERYQPAPQRGVVTAIINLLDAATRERLLARLDELAELERTAKEPPCRPIRTTTARTTAPRAAQEERCHGR
jgi:hypothetical protein